MIWFIGAGPGAPDLITVRGAELLKKADLVIYAGSLVPKELLSWCRKDVRVMNSAAMTLEEVLEAMCSMPEDSTVVRLHTGDPSLYGAIREQMDSLRARGKAFSVVPGVSSMNGAAAALQAEYTLPGVSQTVIVSRMAGRTPVPERESIRSLASHQATMILFLSVGKLPELVRELTAGGYPEDTPCAVVSKASWPDEEVIRGTLADIAPKAAHIGKTALVVVGRVLGDDYDRSLLYDPNFTHGYREAVTKK